MDYRKADPNYVGFVPTTAAEAIDLFCRFRRLGTPPTQWPETFVHVSRALPDEEIDRFQEWLVCPQGPLPAMSQFTFNQHQSYLNHDRASSQRVRS